MDPHESRAVTRCGAVMIGRNEGARLDACLKSVPAQVDVAVYVDSGSHDDSVARALRRGIEVVTLDGGDGFTAARARNAGLARLVERWPDLEFVQFVDGDCELARGWVAAGLAVLEARPDAAVVCGRRRERYPAVSVYNGLCDREWDTPIGIAESSGGDALVRVAAFRAVGGFAPELIAGEEPDLCRRLRDAGWTVHRIDHEMTLHDAAMTRFGQWWQRNRRSGYAVAEALTRRERRDWRLLRPVLSNLFWSLPLAWPLWPLLWWRILRRRDALYATFTVLGKLPHCQGQVDYWRKRRKLIEYK